MLKVIFSIGLVVLVNGTVADAAVLHCKGFQVGDGHPLTDQILELDMKKNLVLSISLLGKGPRDVINAPIIVRKEEFVWSYEAIGIKYILNKQMSILQLLSNTDNKLGFFDCETT
jgi:hypothetical protein